MYGILIKYDYLGIYDGSSSKSPMIGEYYGASLPPRIISSSNEVFIKFDTYVEKISDHKGFMLEYHPNSKYFQNIFL